MASALSGLARHTLHNHVASSSSSSSFIAASRLFSTSSPAFARRTRSVLEEEVSPEQLESLLDKVDDVKDSASSAHLLLQEKRIVRHYLRLIELEMPNLVALRKPFVPPTSKEPLIARSTDYLSNHPVQRKRSIVVAVDDLPLKDEMSKKRLIMLAGPRWAPNPPVDAGISKYADWGSGFVKIACEDYPHPAQNLKWISDTLDKLIERANVPDENWESLPIDLRHVYAKSQKAKKGEHLRGRVLKKPTLRDFPQEWLPKLSNTNEQPTLSSS
ncbi:hypothetical protein D9756_004147 [Leucocoprinus leucothites]|uniref:Small ribosomal subunit protein mS35 mitochondrial conserved domain-containing protein n=1 Tax=Leucocoprinus leucothites TaxID=201217 RepID=A0A8H5G0E9_9AGAR|nr:hypothetical protein D9756_004147 [Leucoagaricus leucothites]